MARRRFFVPEIRRDRAELTGDDAEHLVRVLRVEAGELFEISDNQQAYLAEVETARKSLVSFLIREPIAATPAPVCIRLYPALFKFDRFEWLIEKATECGVSSIHPVQAARSEPGLAQASQKRHIRWEKIALEASQQSRRDRLPSIGPTLAFGQALQTGANIRLFLDEMPQAAPLLSTLPTHRTAEQDVAIMLGPEGGWLDSERQAAAIAGWKPVGLGPTVLRAETAGVAAISIVLGVWLAASSQA